MFYKSDSILLLLSRRIDVGEEERDVMATYERHDTSIIKQLAICFFLATVGSLMGTFTPINGGVGNCGFVTIGWALANFLYVDANCINLGLGEEVFRLVEVGTVTSTCQVPMMEVSVCCYLNIGSATRW